MDSVTSFRNLDFLKRIFGYQTAAGTAAAAGALAAGGSGVGSAGAVAGAAAGAVGAAGNFVLNQAAGAVKNMAILMMILGSVQFFLRWTIGDTHILVRALSIVLFIMAGYAMAESVQVSRWVVFLPMTIFAMWYFVFKANYMPSFLIYFLTSAGLVLVVIDLFTKGKSVKAEVYGFLPVVFFFLDIGLLPFLVNNVGLPITDLTTNLVLWMPWWAFFGLMTFPLDSNEKSFVNATMRFMHILGVLYIVFVFLIPMVPVLGYDQNSFIPSMDDFSGSQGELRERLSEGENPAWSQAVCLYEAIQQLDGEFSINECVEERQKLSQIEIYCEEEGYDKGSNAFEICVKDELEALEEEAGQTSGTTSNQLDQHVDIIISKSNYFDDEVNAQKGNFEAVQFPVEVRIENPNREEFFIGIDCNFHSKDKKIESVGGVVDHASFDSDGLLEVTESDEYTFLCQPTADLNGSYSLNFSTVFFMTTTSYLKRVFVEDNNVKNVDQQIQINSFLDGDTGAYSADEFVRVNFAVGQPSENPVIELDDVPLLVTDIANVGSGTVEYIYGYDLTFDGMNVEGDNDDCVYAEESNFFEEGNRNGDSILVGSCYMEIDYSIEQEVEEDGISFRIFEANVGYLYTLQEQIAVEVDLR